MIYFLSLLPILLIIILSLTKGVKQAVMLGFALTSVLFFYWEASFTHFLGSMGIAFLTTVNILMIVFGALFLYNIMQYLNRFQNSSEFYGYLHLYYSQLL